jgi:5'(3')-deoxyribonucleotidase
VRLGVDVDGVVCDHVAGLVPWIQHRYGIRLVKEQVVDWDLDFGPSTLVKALREAYTDPDFVDSLPVVRGAEASIARLRVNQTILFVTTRPRSIESETKNWLRRHFGIASLLIVPGSKDDIPTDILVDDYPANIIGFARRKRLGILFNQPWNRRVDLGSVNAGAVRVRNWIEVERIVSAWTVASAPATSTGEVASHGLTTESL